MEATTGFETGKEGFAKPCPTTSLCRHHLSAMSFFSSPSTHSTGKNFVPWNIQLFHVTNGAGDGARTRYLHLGKVALYQMSYARI